MWLLISLLLPVLSATALQEQLSFSPDGKFKILQVSDMHFGNGESTSCLDVPPSQKRWCSDLNTTAFLRRMIQAENPNLIVFTGDNIFGSDARDAAASMEKAFAPAIESNIPWAAVLGNHDQESDLSREEVMKYIVKLNNTLSMVNPEGVRFRKRFGNYNLQVRGPQDSTSLLNLFFLDSGDYSSVPWYPGYAWILRSQKLWFLRTALRLRENNLVKLRRPAPALVYFHIPVPEFKSIDAWNMTGIRQEGTGSAKKNSGFFEGMREARDVIGAFVGHDHVNDFCGKKDGVSLCYGGGFGYHAYGKVGWARRARVVVASLERMESGAWGDVQSVVTWKRLDDDGLSVIDEEELWRPESHVLSH